ncbi:MAG: hypothetical protein J6I40_09080 [Mailhella sp.]|nr:hypothetical protein [Mailhella sp.]
MNIEWKITKKRGNLRPVLTYCVTLEEFEKELALPPLRVSSTIPEPQDSWQEYCYPGQMERAEGNEPSAFYELESPSHRGKSWPQTLRLPWREGNAYPEVEESFQNFRSEFEKMLRQAYASAPMNEERSLSSSNAVRAHVAPGVAAARFLRMAGRSAIKPEETAQ